MKGLVDKHGRSSLPEEVYDLEDMDDPRNADNAAALLRMSSDQRAALERRLQKFDPGLEAKYKLEVTFAKRSTTEAYNGSTMVFRNRGEQHGGGDSLVYFCQQPRSNGESCDSPIRDELHGRTQVVCEVCMSAQLPADLYSERRARLPTQLWAKHLHWRMQTLGMNADLVMNYIPGDFARYTMEMREKRGVAHASDMVDRIRANMQRVVYPLHRMLDDTANGSSLESRIRAFLEA